MCQLKSIKDYSLHNLDSQSYEKKPRIVADDPCGYFIQIRVRLISVSSYSSYFKINIINYIRSNSTILISCSVLFICGLVVLSGLH